MKKLIIISIFSLFIFSCDDDLLSPLDECGVVNGDNSTCTDECGVINGYTIEECGSCEYVYLWGECYNIDVTTELDLRYENDNLSSYPLSGEIPPEIGKLTNLTLLILDGNQFTEVPPEIGNLTNLKTFSMSSNQLTEIPPEIGNLTNLEGLLLSGNQLTGEIPPEIGNLINLTTLSLPNNQLIGEIPPEIGNLINLILLEIDNNQLTGEIPLEIGQLTNLEVLSLSNNQLTGDFPSHVLHWESLRILNIHNNQFTSISQSICNLINLIWTFDGQSLWWEYSTIHNNNICPPYPFCIEDVVGTQDTSNCP